MERKKGFTLIELLVVIAVIALLLSILVPALRMARDQVKRLYCANNIKQILFGLLAYGNENRNSIPMDPGVPDWHYPNAGYWPWDISYYITNEIQKGFGVNIQDLKLKSGQDMPIQPIFYCPANMAQKRNRSLYWSYAIDPDTHAGYRILGYLFLWYASWNNDGKGRILGTEGSGSKKWVNRVDMPMASDKEMVTDVVMSQDMPGEPKYPLGKFADIVVGGNRGLDGSSHLVSASKPMGGNIGFLDGHVEWRPFGYMEKRFQSGPWWWW